MAVSLLAGATFACPRMEKQAALIPALKLTSVGCKWALQRGSFEHEMGASKHGGGPPRAYIPQRTVASLQGHENSNRIVVARSQASLELCYTQIQNTQIQTAATPLLQSRVNALITCLRVRSNGAMGLVSGSLFEDFCRPACFCMIPDRQRSKSSTSSASFALVSSTTVPIKMV